MKLRIIKVDSTRRMNGEYIVQRREFLFWWVEVTVGTYYDYQKAWEAAMNYKRDCRARNTIRGIWPL